MVRLFLILILIYGGITHSIFAQLNNTRISLDAGMNVTTIQHNLPIIGVEPRYTYHYGLSLYSYLDQKQQFWVKYGANIDAKGYRQNLEGNLGQFRFIYLSFPMSVAWQPFDLLALQAGLEFSRCLSVRFNDIKGSRGIGKYYANYDIAALGGLFFFPKKTFSPFMMCKYGLIAISRQATFDQLGNFVGEMHQKHLVFQMGINIEIVEK